MSSNQSKDNKEFKCSCYFAFGSCVWPTPCEPNESDYEIITDDNIKKEEQLSLL